MIAEKTKKGEKGNGRKMDGRKMGAEKAAAGLPVRWRSDRAGIAPAAGSISEPQKARIGQ